MFSKLIPFVSVDLQLFADGGGTGGDGGATGVSAGVPGSPNGSTSQVASANDSTEAGVLETDRKAKFEALIKGEYKDLYDERVQNTIKERFKGKADAEEKIKTLNPILELLGKRYNVDPTDAKALSSAMEDDDSYFEEEALERGISVKELKEIRKMERENADLKAQLQEKREREQAEKDIAEWMRQAQEAAEVFPGLDLGEELKNPSFLSLLKNGIDVETAYFAIHHKQLVPKAMQYAAKSAETAVANRVKANGLRPAENGTTNSAVASPKMDVSQLTKAQRAEIAMRVARGEKIRF